MQLLEAILVTKLRDDQLEDFRATIPDLLDEVVALAQDLCKDEAPRGHQGPLMLERLRSVLESSVDERRLQRLMQVERSEANFTRFVET